MQETLFSADFFELSLRTQGETWRYLTSIQNDKEHRVATLTPSATTDSPPLHIISINDLNANDLFTSRSDTFIRSSQSQTLLKK